MKVQTILGYYLTILLCFGSVPLVAQGHVDITLEGPWIIYVDKTHATDQSGKPYPVLVLVSPVNISNDNPKKTDWYHTPRVTNGDGYPVDDPNNGAMIYCLVWSIDTGDQCAPNLGGSPTLTSDGYPSSISSSPLLLTLNASPSANQPWDWVKKYTSSLTGHIFVLPMPDTYSTFAGWYMRFADKWYHDGTKYYPYKGEEHSTGIELHYSSGPKSFKLQTCNAASGSVNLKTCTPKQNTELLNIGNLSIAMKSPSNNACDPHVRRAYSQMMNSKLFDGNNAAHTVIDTARGSDAQFDIESTSTAGRCLDNWDPQKPASHIGLMTAETRLELEKKSEEKESSFTKELLLFSKQIDAYLNNPNKDSNINEENSLLQQISDAIKNLDPEFPRFSQLRLIETLLKESETQENRLHLEFERSSDMLLDFEHSSDISREQSVLKWGELLEKPLNWAILVDLEIHFLTSKNAPVKTGNDCNAPLVMVN